MVSRLLIDEKLIRENFVNRPADAGAKDGFTCTGNKLRLTAGTAVHELTRSAGG
ncbi:hypothetical protein [Amycolatopsis vastitatis]|uniref:hypothetical protein n=1 Tax=Amycolatopsis vastitatis TaxID=1905142 RepID=UPI0013047325|nr:hypothetical protein [Amycolatopsis vastitatis]